MSTFDYGVIISIKIIRSENIIDIKTTLYHFWIYIKATSGICFKIDNFHRGSAFFGYTLQHIQQIDHASNYKELVFMCNGISVPIIIASDKKLKIGIVDVNNITNVSNVPAIAYTNINDYFKIKKSKSVISYILNILI